MVWMGDMGQADAQVGSQLAAEHPVQGGGYLSSGGPLVLVHDIVPSASTAMPGTNLSSRRTMAEAHVFVFDSYVDAALLALQAGVISCAGALQVAATCCREAGLHPPSIQVRPAQVQAWLAGVQASESVSSVPAAPAPADAQEAAARCQEARAALTSIAGCALPETTCSSACSDELPSLPMGMGLYSRVADSCACSCHCPVHGVGLVWRDYQHVARYHQLHAAVCSAAGDAAASAQAHLPGPNGETVPTETGGGTTYVLKDSPWFPVAQLAGDTTAAAALEWSCQLACPDESAAGDAFPSLQHAAHCPEILAALEEAQQLRELPLCIRSLELQAAVGRLVGFIAVLACIGTAGSAAGTQQQE